jgi:hypothetical protein
MLFIIQQIYISVYAIVSVPTGRTAKVWVLGRLLAEIVGSNPAGGMDVCLS